MPGATRPVQGGTYSSPRSEPGGQNTPRAGRVVASLGAYVSSSGLFAQQIDQGDIFDESAIGIAIANGVGIEDYSCDDSASGTIIASGTSSEFYTYTYDAVIDIDLPVSHWKLGETTQATDRKGVQNLRAISSPPLAASLIDNNGSNAANSFDGARSPAIAQRFSVPAAVGVGTPYNTSAWSVELWIKPSSFVGSPDVILRSGSIYIWISSATGTVVWSFNGVSINDGTLVAGKTAHIVATSDGATGKGYIDGTLAITQPGITTNVTGNNAPIIGSRAESAAQNGAFIGVIDEVAWYGTELSAARVLDHYRAGLRFEIFGIGSSVESYVYTDATTGTITASGSRSESYIYTDVSTGTITAKAAAFTYADEVKVDSPIGYWRMGTDSPSQPEESGGTALVLNGATPNVPGATLSLGPAVSFDGVNDYGRVSSLDLSGTDKITVEAWLKWDAYANDDRLALEHGETNQAKGWAWDPNSSSADWVAFSPNVDGGLFQEQKMSRPVSGTWHHIVVQIDHTAALSDQQIAFYVDGVSVVGSQITASDLTGNFQNYPLTVMARSALSDGVKNLFGAGDMQHLAVYDHVLSSARILAHYNARGRDIEPGEQHWTNYVFVAAPANGTNTHTIDPSSASNVISGTPFSPTAGRLLVVVATGQVTSTTPSGWTLPAGASSVGFTGLYAWTRDAAGADIFSTTHNASNFPVGFAIFEFPAGSTFVAAAASAQSVAALNPTLSGLTVVTEVFGVAAQPDNVTGGTLGSASWTAPNVELVDYDQDDSAGYWLGIAYQRDYASTTYTPTPTITPPQATQGERLTFAIGAPSGVTYTDNASGTIIASGSVTESAVHSASATGTIAVSGSSLETAVHTGTGTGSITASGTGTDSYVYSDTSIGTISVTGTGIDFSVGIDVGIGNVVASGTSTDSYVYSDISIGTITVTGISTDLSVHTGTGIGNIVASGAGVDSYVYPDASSGTISVTGTGIDFSAGTDTGVGSITASGTGTDSYVYSDTGTGNIVASGTSSDIDVYSDISIGTIASTGTGLDTFDHSGLNSGTTIVSGTGLESATYTDGLTGTTLANGTSSETVVYTTSAIGTIVVSGTGLDNRVYDDVSSGTALLSGTGVDSWATLIGYIDARSGQINLSGTGVESQSHDSTAIVSGLASGTSVESQFHSSTAIGNLVADGTGVESQSYTDTAIGSVVVSGTGVESQSHSSTAIGFGLVSGTASETYSSDIPYTDVSTGTITSTGTGIDSVSYSFTLIGTVAFLGNGVDSYVGEDTSIGTIVLTGTARESPGYVQAIQPGVFSTIIALNQVKVNVWAKTPIQSVVSHTTPLAVQIVVQRNVKADVVNCNELKVLMTNH